MCRTTTVPYLRCLRLGEFGYSRFKCQVVCLEGVTYLGKLVTRLLKESKEVVREDV